MKIFLKLFRLIREFWWRVIIYVILLAIASWFEASISLQTGGFIQQLSHVLNTILVSVVFIAILKIGYRLLDFLLWFFYFPVLNNAIRRKIRSAIQQKLLSLPSLQIQLQNQQEFQAGLIKAQEEILRWYTSFFTELLSSILAFVAGVYGMILLHSPLVFLFIGGAVIYGIFFAMRTRWRRPKNRTLVNDYRSLNSRFRMMWTGDIDIASNISKMHAWEQDMRAWDKQETYIQILGQQVFGNLNNIAFDLVEIGMLLLSLVFVQNAGSCILLTMSLTVTVRGIINRSLDSGERIVYIEQFFAFMQNKPLYSPLENRAPQIVSYKERLVFDHVVVDYPTVYDLLKPQDVVSHGRKGVLQDISFQLKPGIPIAIVGISGAGKTTLLRVIDRVLRPSSGNVLLDGVPLFTISDSSYIVKEITPAIIDSIQKGTLRENLLATIRDRESFPTDEELVLHLTRFGLSLSDLGNDGLDTILLEGGGNLSSGQRWRVAIAAQMLVRPHILLLDEITSNLDPLIGKVVVETILAEAKHFGIFVLFVTHKLHELQYVEQILFLEKGRVAGFGTEKELLQYSNSFRRLKQAAEN